MTIKVVSVDRIRQIESAADATGLPYDTMMQNAGRAVASRVIDHLGDKTDARVSVLIGAGNNGGDGLVAGRIIAEESHALVRFYLAKPREADDENFKAVQDANLPVALAADDRDGRVLRNMVASSDVVVDAIFGIGLKLPLRLDTAKLLRTINQALNDHQLPEQPQGIIINPSKPAQVTAYPKPYVIAVDCPSGMDCDTGALDPNTIPADETVTFIAVKKGLLEFPAAGIVGELSVATIGLSDDLPELKAENYSLADASLASGFLPARSVNANKGTFGKVMVLAGSVNYIGAAGLTSMSAFRSGTGLVTVAAPHSVVSNLSGHLLEPTWISLPETNGSFSPNAIKDFMAQVDTYTALLVGPGWGRHKATADFLLKLLKQEKLPPLVIDADALNILSEVDSWWKLLPPETVITPHPGEMARLAKSSTADVQANRWKIAAEKAAEWKVNLVLKGAHTLIASPDGRIIALPFKSDALSTAGTGDVLAGLITGMLGQGVKPYEAAILGGYVHGLAGNLAAEALGNSRSVVAGDVLTSISNALTLLCASH
ncbi:MAG: NAD(P)H-hydrate dehydratase [Anaerolineae bacterium]|nr:NAD(P)H-hydrate dehydratase [Anaerolineae bacterium]